MTDNQIISLHQHGFQMLRSSQTAVLSLTNKLFSAHDNRQFSILPALDYSKASDCISHDFLPSKRSNLGFSINSAVCSKAYLADRQQVVKYNGALSNPLLANYGVLQGSMCDPTLFSIHLNDLLQLLPKCFIAYADDLTLVVINKKLNNAFEQMQQIFNIVAARSAENYFAMNLGKYQCMLINPSKKGGNLTSRLAINGQALSICTELTILGIKLSSTLTWSAHAH